MSCGCAAQTSHAGLKILDYGESVTIFFTQFAHSRMRIFLTCDDGDDEERIVLFYLFEDDDDDGGERRKSESEKHEINIINKT